MGKSIGNVQPTGSRSMVLKELREEQEKLREGSCDWITLETKIREIVAQNYLEYVNR